MVVTVLLASGVLVLLRAEVELVQDRAHAQIPHHNMAATTALDWDQVLKVKVASVTIVQVREKKAAFLQYIASEVLFFFKKKKIVQY